ncbi:MAG: succinate dehydrogenase cytochrome b subunit [Proteobacteria bacterium]|nr:succinate dehydrogenase cytochrome b subunit [Pseudomonadota bacterium]
MSWLVKTLSTSVGKKLVMAVTGLFFCCFLVVHLLGNLTLYKGMETFNGYVDHLHALGPLIRVAEVLMLVFALVHVTTGLMLTYQNYMSRPVKYQMNKSGGGRTLGSATMPYTGIVLIFFVIAHLLGFHFADHETQTVYDIVSHAFSDPVVVGYYVVAMLVVAVHVSHGFWSAFQSLGVNHEKYNPAIKALALVFSLVVGAGFGLIPVYMSLFI